MNRIQEILFSKSFPKLAEKLGAVYPSIKTSTDNNQQQQEHLIFSIAQSKLKIYEAASTVDFLKVVSVQSQKVQEYDRKYPRIPDMIRNLYIYSSRYSIFEVMPESEGKIEEKELVKTLLTLESPSQYFKHETIIKRIKESLYLSITFLQLQTRRLLAVKKSDWGFQIEYLFEFLIQTDRKYPESHKVCKKICLILSHVAIHYFNSLVSVNNILAAQEFLILIQKYYIEGVKLLTRDSVVVLLYNCVKILLGVDMIPEQLSDHIRVIFKRFRIEYSKSYGENILQMFFLIKMLIFKKSESKNINPFTGSRQPQQNHGIMKPEKDVQINSTSEEEQFENLEELTASGKFLLERLSTFLNVNLDTIVVQLDQISQNIIRHRVASLATLICFKLGIKRFSKHFIELMHDSPFNNDIQTIKLCFQLFEAREFSKLQQLFQIVLSAPSCKILKEREVLLAMCSIFTGLYLQNRQEGLLYAKLNHQESKKAILRQENLLSHVGFAYYNLGNHEQNLSSRQVYLTQALYAFKRSYEINPHNYIVTYCMGKICLTLYSYEQAYKYAIESCKSGRGKWVPFTLLACVYMCQRKVVKATIIIEELFKKYTDVALLHYIRAYLEVNRILLQVEADQQLESSKTLGLDYYQIYRQKVLKSKSINVVLRECQLYHQLGTNIMVTEYDQSYLVNSLGEVVGQSEQILYNILGLLFELDQLILCENIIKNMPNNPRTLFCKGKLHELRKEMDQARHQYKATLWQSQYNVETLAHLALIEMEEDIEKSAHYIELAENINDGSLVTFAKGMLLSKLDKVSQAHQEFLKEREVAWCKDLPDLIYYY